MPGKYRIDRVGNGENKCAQAVLPIKIHQHVAQEALDNFVSAGHIYRAWIIEGYNRDSKKWGALRKKK